MITITQDTALSRKMVTSQDDLFNAGQDEEVEVNQRDLIYKILARYSGEFTVFRELLQNSDDAGARSVEIRFETEEYLSREEHDDTTSDESEQEDIPDLKTAVVKRWTLKNNGMLFREEDWKRIKRIADGNPDEKKIGAFGVGFYSLFSITEKPWVTSGGKWMSFYWKDNKDQLFVRRGPAADPADPWTSFQMTLKKPGPMPPAFDFTRFLVTSIAFMAHLSEVSVYFDDKRLVKLSKNRGVSKKVPMLKELKGVSPEGIMNVKSIKTTTLHIEAEVVELVYKVGSEKPSVTSTTDVLESSSHNAGGFFSLPSDGFEGSPTPQRTPTQVPVMHEESIDLLEAHSSNIVLTIFAANVDVRLNEIVTEELRDATRKKPPSQLLYELIYTGKDEYDSSVKAEKEAAYATGGVFQGLRADLEGAGSTRVFIGHATGQTTGLGGHMATRFIPTVERESIDLVNPNVAVWNKELLYVGGFLARSAYELELGTIKNLWESAAASPRADGLQEVRAWLRERALHALKFFSFHTSTPSPMVSNLMEDAFFACSTTRPFPILASDGVRNATEVYILHPEFSGFIKYLSVISEDIVNGAKTMITALRSRGMIKNITFVDVLDELRSRPLSEAETVKCLKWWIRVTKERNFVNAYQERSQLLHALVVSMAGPPERTMRLSDAQTFLKSKTSEAIIPTHGPLPSTLLPSSISCSFDRDTLASFFLWTQLSIVDWLRHLTDRKVAATNSEFDVTKSASWAEQVLFVLVRAWPELNKTDEMGVIQTLSPMSCIPTSTGLKVPNKAYFPNADFSSLFRGLSIVTMPSGAIVEGTLELVLTSLGVRKHVEVQIIFDRVVETGDWTTYDLVHYLASIQQFLTTQEFERLRRMPAFLKEKAGKEQLAAGASRKVQRYKAKDLYEPNDLFRELGLPIIDWGVDHKWDPKSYDARFILSLDLKQAPPLPKLLQMAASDNPTLRTKALAFFLDNTSSTYRNYDPQHFGDLAFVPAVLGSEEMLAKPYEVCIDPKWTALGFAVVDPKLPEGAAQKLRLNHRPHNSELVRLLERSPPEDETTARSWFEILYAYVLGFSLGDLQKLSETPFVPVQSTGYKGDNKTLRPRQCFLGKQRSELHSKLFAFVDFGTRANDFLKRCSTSEEPSVEDIAQVLLADPQRVYELANGRNNYLSQLRELALDRKKLEEGTIHRMRLSKMLLGSRRVKSAGGNASIEDDGYLQDKLLQPSEVVIVDDINAHQLFGDHIFCAPQDEIIEKLYTFLGSPILSSLIRENHTTSHELPNSEIAAEIRHLLLDRLPLFLHNQSSRTKLSSDWLNNKNNVIVKAFEKISVTKSLYHGTIHESTTYDTSMIAKQDGSGPIELLLAGNKKPKMHEISISLCRIIFESPEVHDTASFMCTLQLDLAVLKDMGYPVDKIERQKAEREAAEREAAEREEAEREAAEREAAEREAADNEIAEIGTLSIPSAPEISVQEKQTRIPITQPKIPSPDTAIRAPSPQASRGNIGPEQKSKPSYGPGHHQPPSSPDSPSPRLTPSPESEDIPLPSKSVPPPPSSDIPEQESKPGPPRHCIAPLSNIVYSVDMAIKRLTPERGNLLRNIANNANMAVEEYGPDDLLLEIANDINMAVEASVPKSETLLQRLFNNINAAIGASPSKRNNLLRNLASDIGMVIEAGVPASGKLPTIQEMKPLDERFCDDTGETMDILLAGSIGGIEVFAASDLPEPELLVKQKRVILDRFLDILKPLVAVYEIPHKSLNIFADGEGQFILFNRGGNLFLNLRYFEAWHDNDVEQDNRSEALTFWYFMLAHGIAHNIVDKHDLKHEFVVSFICGKYLEPLIDFLS